MSCPSTYHGTAQDPYGCSTRGTERVGSLLCGARDMTKLGAAELVSCQRVRGHYGPHMDGELVWGDRSTTPPSRCPERAAGPAERCYLLAGHEGQHLSHGGYRWDNLDPLASERAATAYRAFMAALAELPPGAPGARCGEPVRVRVPDRRLGDAQRRWVLGHLTGEPCVREAGHEGEHTGIEEASAEPAGPVWAFHAEGEPVPYRVQHALGQCAEPADCSTRYPEPAEVAAAHEAAGRQASEWWLGLPLRERALVAAREAAR